MMRSLPVVLLSGLILALWVGLASASQVRIPGIDPAPVTDFGNGSGMMLAMGGRTEKPKNQNQSPSPPNQQQNQYQNQGQNPGQNPGQPGGYQQNNNQQPGYPPLGLGQP